jgi:geranylgeranyl pyrophosphate synthase
LGLPAAANLAAAFQATALELLRAEGGVSDPMTKLAAWRSLNQMMLTTAFGQYLDTQNPADEAAYWRVVETKSAPFYGAAFQVGALSGSASIEIAEQLKQLGQVYGEIIQIHDDLNDAMAAPANPDWMLGRSSLPMLFAQSVDYPERGRFLELRRVLQSVPDPEALAEAQLILIRCGAISYSLYELTRRHSAAQEMLNGLTLCRRTGLELLFEDLIEPVKKLLATIAVA